MNRMIRDIIYALFLLVDGYACRPAPTEADREKLYAQLRRADSCARSKQEEQAIQLYFEWLERSEGKVNTLTRANVYDKIGKLYLYRNLYVDALDMFRKSAGIYRDMGAWKEEAGAWRNIGRTHLMRQRGDSIIQSYQRAIQLAEETGEQELLKGIQQEFQFVCSKTALPKSHGPIASNETCYMISKQRKSARISFRTMISSLGFRYRFRCGEQIGLPIGW